MQKGSINQTNDLKKDVIHIFLFEILIGIVYKLKKIRNKENLLVGAGAPMSTQPC